MKPANLPAWPRAAVLTALLLGTAACRGEPPRRDPATIAEMVDSLRPSLERAAGLTFKATPRSATRTRNEFRAFLLQKLDEELPPERLRGIESAYRLFGLIPDTLQLRALLLDLYTEQVAGFYDPETATLYGVEGADRGQLTLVLAHEMVHALQHQYTPLDSLLGLKGDTDRLAAAQAIFEGQANLVSIKMLIPDAATNAAFWENFLETLRAQQNSMAVFSAAPRVVREGLLFPYVTGAEFMRWWEQSPYRDTLPYGPRMPVSTEQIIHPDRYHRGDRPIAVRFAAADSGVLYEDGLGELEIRILEAELAGSDQAVTPVAIGWGGDRYRVYDAPGGPALVWYVVWDGPAYAERFESGAGRLMAERSRAGYRVELAPLTVGEARMTRLVVAPAGWRGWAQVPDVTAD